MDNVEFLILRNLLHNEEYVRKVIPFIKADYFEDHNQKVVFEEISKFVSEYTNRQVRKYCVLRRRNVKILMILLLKKLLH